jgi:hypothetical protein
MSQATSTTAFDANSLTVTAAGSFAYDLTTTGDFVDPSSDSIYSPGGAADYECYFTLNAPSTYVVNVELDGHSKVFLGSFEAGFIFNQFNVGPAPLLVHLTGTIPVGHYEIGVESGLGVPNFSNGIHQYSANGGFSNFNFSVQVPEPTTLGFVIAVARTICNRKRSVGAS